ncbi:unconventional myosin-IXa-like isoform X2 [Xenia sp. Carnegie-2017]|uniref:unconventional myosin-IXa-like isoform X2 n=1 Tax=Xenia sp. Carnegie-2017 TaxID=2897299 RepID=UPI001F04EFC6|nr:unconventional myosin-IXa-like isoform X2 [Xenia sp. Carnegie-2017]
MDDLIECGVQSDSDIVHFLKKRFIEQKYYTEVGDVLVTVNPWKSLVTLQNEVFDYLARSRQSQEIFLPIHPCSVAERAIRNGVNAVIVPLGESGSGKSWNIESIFHYVVQRKHCERLTKDSISGIIEVLHLFCNAKTLICNSSTRCIKIYDFWLNKKDRGLLGVNVQVSLLDKLRVVGQIQNEGNFHIFYHVLNSLTPNQLRQFLLHGNTHRYLSSFAFQNYTGGAAILSSLKCLQKIGLSEKEIVDIMHIVIAIILLGDLQFCESSKRDVMAFRNGNVLETAASLLGISAATLADLITTKSKTVKGQKIKMAALCSQAMYECDRLAVFIYESLLMSLVAKINSRFYYDTRVESYFSLVLLDVFGWENYSICSYDQLCINSVNEILHTCYNAIVFTAYEENLKNENILLNESSSKFDHPGAVTMLFKPKGLFDVLHSNVDRNDYNLLKKFNGSLKKEARYFENPKKESSRFSILHFIGEVFYDVIGFTSRSRSWTNENLLLNLRASRNPVLSIIMMERSARENQHLEKTYMSQTLRGFSNIEKNLLKTRTFLTECIKDKQNLASLKQSNPASFMLSLTGILNRLLSSKAYFIRCIKSNLKMIKENFDEERVLRQVQWSNLLGIVKTRPFFIKISLSMSEFLDRYKLLFFSPLQVVSASSDLINNLLRSKFRNGIHYNVGISKVFLSKNLFNQLEDMLKSRIQQIIRIQKVFRGYLGRKRYKHLLEIKKKYDEQCSLFLSQIYKEICKFHEHLSLQISEDQREIKENKTMAGENRNPLHENKSSSSGRCAKKFSISEVITEETWKTPIWCNIRCFQRSKQQGVFPISVSKITIDNSDQMFSSDRISFNSFPSDDEKIQKVKSCIGKGVELYLSDDNSLLAVRLCKNAIFVKGHFCGEELRESSGELPKKKESIVFDFKKFVEKVSHVCHPVRINDVTEEKCLSLCIVHLCFVKDSANDEDTPCWVEIELSRAEAYLKQACLLSFKKRREVQDETQQPKSRNDSKIDLTSEKILKDIRPSRPVDTTNLSRKAWARKRVVSNPFLYGDDSFKEKSDDSVCSPANTCDDDLFHDSSTNIDESENIKNYPRSKSVSFFNKPRHVEYDRRLSMTTTIPKRDEDVTEGNVSKK